ncbi:MAG: hypothetical protein LBT89_10230 [Planctomycetaceae bacterium]|jgi:hypothetical protein|nr:hypothetical protein [Planctomycetaceae bacterium]
MIIPDGSPFRQIIGDVRTAFEKAEQYLKEDELVDCGLLIPAVNQLRYAGEHLARALCLDDAEKSRNALNESLNHCYRAVFDALEVKTQFYLGECQDFEKIYGNINITPVIPSYLEDSKAVREIQNTVPKMRRPGENRYQFWDKLENLASSLQTIHAKWMDARQELNKCLKKDRRDTRRFWIGLILAVAGLIASICWSKG